MYGKLNLYIDVIYNLDIVDCLFRVLDVVLHCIRVPCVARGGSRSNSISKSPGEGYSPELAEVGVPIWWDGSPTRLPG